MESIKQLFTFCCSVPIVGVIAAFLMLLDKLGDRLNERRAKLEWEAQRDSAQSQEG